MAHDVVGLDGRGVRLTPTGIKFSRVLTWEEWCELGAGLAAHREGLMWWVGDWYNHGSDNHPDKPVEQAVEELFGEQVARGTVKNAGYVSGMIPESRRRDKCSWSHHYEVAGLESAKDADELLDRTVAEGLSRREVRKLVRAKKAGRAEPKAIPAGLYDVIYADPPWHYEYAPGEEETDELGLVAKPGKRNPRQHYNTMSVDDICNLQIPAAADAVLFLWATAPLLPEALRVMGCWGFDYKSQAVWDKEILGMGYWFRGQHELLLVGTRGHVSPPEESARVSSVVRIRRSRRHSEKPTGFHELIEAYFPNASRLELFARATRPGWSSWGDEL